MSWWPPPGYSTMILRSTRRSKSGMSSKTQLLEIIFEASSNNCNILAWYRMEATLTAATTEACRRKSPHQRLQLVHEESHQLLHPNLDPGFQSQITPSQIKRETNRRRKLSASQAATGRSRKHGSRDSLRKISFSQLSTTEAWKITCQLPRNSMEAFWQVWTQS